MLITIVAVGSPMGHCWSCYQSVGIAIHGVVVLELWSSTGGGIRQKNCCRHLLLEMQLGMLLIPIVLVVVVFINLPLLLQVVPFLTQ